MILTGRLGGCGSSPLTRGKHTAVASERPQLRLIPAHAGKTPMVAARPILAPAHPRSRGENTLSPYRGAKLSGSSPLTRGKLLLSL